MRISRMRSILFSLLVTGGWGLMVDPTMAQPPAATSNPAPLVESSSPSRHGKKTPIPEGDAYKRDPAYQALLRYDYLPYWLNHEKQLMLDNGEEDPGVRKQDRALVLAGKGFKIPDLQRFEPEANLEINLYQHIQQNEYRPPLAVEPDRLDPELERVGSQKELIFRPRISSFYNTTAPQVTLETPAPPPAPVRRAPVPQTRLLLSDEGHTELTLTPAPKQWDLLKGNEIENRMDFTQTR